MFKKWDFLFPHQLIQRLNKGLSLPSGLEKVFQGLAHENSRANPVQSETKEPLPHESLLCEWFRVCDGPPLGFLGMC